MRPVIAVSLNGRAYQLEDEAHEALAQYLDAAQRALAGNPDRSEIIADLEQAIADKCERFLSAHKTVLTVAEIAGVIEEMGPVEAETDTEGAGTASGPQQTPGGTDSTTQVPPKRLYQISEGALLSGVCTGLAVYFDVDVTLVRLLFVIAAILTGGLAVLVYLAMMFIVPYANTPEEVAAASGLPFNARALIEQWKRNAARFADAAANAARRNASGAEHARWHAEWRRARAQWRGEWRKHRADWHAHRWHAWNGTAPPAPPPLPPAAAFLSGLGWAVLGILVGLVTLAWLVALLSLLATGALFGWSLPHLPLWAAIIVLIVLYQLVVSPLRALRYAHSPHLYAYRYRSHALADAVVGLTILALLVWLFEHHLPAVQHTLNVLGERLSSLWRQATAPPH